MTHYCARLEQHWQAAKVGLSGPPSQQRPSDTKTLVLWIDAEHRQEPISPALSPRSPTALERRLESHAEVTVERLLISPVLYSLRTCFGSPTRLSSLEIFLGWLA